MQAELQAILDVFNHRGFLVGLVGGLVGAALLSVAGLTMRRSPFGWGVIFAGVVAFGLTTRAELDAEIGWKLLLVIAAGLLVDLVSAYRPEVHRTVTTGAWVAAGVAVWIVIGREFTQPFWISIAFPLTVVGLGLGVWGLRRLAEADLAGPMLAISVGGIWVTVPETDLVTVMLGAVLPMGLVTLPPIRARATAAGALALSFVVTWLALEGGTPRPWTVATAWATSATIPLIALLVRSTKIRPGRGSLFAIHVIYVAAITRVADITESEVVVLLWSMLLIVLATLALLLIPWPRKADTSPS